VSLIDAAPPEKRLHEAIGYVTPNDEHEGRGEQIRAARTDGLKIADEQRRDWHRNHRGQR
jgi:putative transposase